MEQEHQAWLQRKHERDEKLARGEDVGPQEDDPTAEQEVGLLGLLKFIVYLILFVVIAGKFFTGSFLWEYEGKWARLKTYWPVRMLSFIHSTIPDCVKLPRRTAGAFSRKHIWQHLMVVI